MEVHGARTRGQLEGARRDRSGAEMDPVLTPPGDETGPGPELLQVEDYPAYPEGAGMGIGSVSEQEPATALGTGGELTGATLARSTGQEDWLAGPMRVPGDPTEISEPIAGEPALGPLASRLPALPAAPTPAPLAQPVSDCAVAACQQSVRAAHLRVLDVGTGQTWPALRPPRT